MSRMRKQSLEVMPKLLSRLGVPIVVESQRELMQSLQPQPSSHCSPDLAAKASERNQWPYPDPPCILTGQKQRICRVGH
jgi:hypothetical protein